VSGVLEIAGGVTAGDETWRQAMRRELDLFERMNIKSFTDKAGRNWKLSNYAEMVSRTVPMHVMNVGKMNEFLEYGEDLVVVSDFSPTCPLCAPWGGAVLSISGAAKGYPAVSEAEEAGLFHPRCLHAFALYSDEVWGKPDADGRVRHVPEEMAEDLKLFTKENVIIPDAKLTAYALNKNHPKGGNKAIVFESALGYNQSNALELKQAILDRIEEAEKVYRETTEHGRAYNALMDITGPNGKTDSVITAWIVRFNELRPQLITTYMAKKKKQRG
jgi:hypothetical protein